MIKLHLGCGKRDFGEDWINIDGADFPHIKYHNIKILYPFEDNSVDLIYASHVIEYFDRDEIIPILTEWKRVLKQGAILRLAVPDFGAMAHLYSYDSEKYPLYSFLGPLYGKMKMGEQLIYHKTTYDYDSLGQLLQTIGFIEIRKWNWWEVDHGKFDDHSQAYLPHMQKETGTLISLNVEAIK